MTCPQNPTSSAWCWGSSPDFCGTPPQISRGPLATCPHTAQQLPHVTAPWGIPCVCLASPGCPHNLWDRLFPQTLHCCLFTVFTTKMGSCFGLAIYFLPLVYNPVLKDQTEAVLSELKHWAIHPNSITHFPRKQAAARAGGGFQCLGSGCWVLKNE